MAQYRLVTRHGIRWIIPKLREYELLVQSLLNRGAVYFVLLLLLLAVEIAWGCDRYPVEQGALVRQYLGPNGLLYQEYDTDGDKDADWGVAYKMRDGLAEQWPLFYAAGFDKPEYKDPSQIFTAVIVWKDMNTAGRCEDITEVYVRRDNKPLDMDKLEKGGM